MAASTSAPDDFEAVRAVVEALKPFAADDQRRILRWAQEKLGLTSFAGSVPTVSAAATALSAEERPVPPGRSRDIRSFLDGKKPSNDVQFAAAVPITTPSKLLSISSKYRRPTFWRQRGCPDVFA